MIDDKILRRFMSKVQKSEDGCWLWTSGTTYGYGSFKMNGKNHRAHRVSWLVHNGPIPDGMHVLHDCPGADNKLCVNPDHLYLGTCIENGRDRRNKNQVARGERSGNAKLTNEKVKRARQLYRDGFDTDQLSLMFEVSKSAIYYAVTGKTWQFI